VKYGIPAATLLLLGAVFCLHRTVEPGRAPGARSGGVVSVEQELLPEPTPRSVAALEPLRPDPEPNQKRPEVASAARPASAESWRKLYVSLDRELALTSVQQAAVERILRDRQDQLRECHEAIRKSGVLDMRHYEGQVAVMKAAWYRKIDILLDSAQHERFMIIVEQGFFNDGLAFTHEPGMTVLD
jgi:hypothetical protein